MRLSGQLLRKIRRNMVCVHYLTLVNTLGHSIEKLMNFSLAHGECVAVGSLLAADISCQRGYISEEENKEIKELYAYFDFPALPEELKAEDIVKRNKT